LYDPKCAANNPIGYCGVPLALARALGYDGGMSENRFDDDPYHPIIDRPWQYDIVELCYYRNPPDFSGARLDLTL
jgi:hypothetical protein